MSPSIPTDFLEVDDLDPATLAALLDRAEAWKRAPRRVPPSSPAGASP